MIVLPKQTTRWLIQALGLLCLVLLVSACSLFGGSSPSAGSTPTPVANITPLPTSSNSSNVYSNSNFSISYPPGWQATTSTVGVNMTDSLGIYSMTVSVSPNPTGAISADQIANTSVVAAKRGIQNVKTVQIAASTSVAGQTWSQRAITGTTTINGGQANVEIVVLATNHPNQSVDTKAFVITYETIQDTFTQAQSTYFLPMLQTFKFSS